MIRLAAILLLLVSTAQPAAAVGLLESRYIVWPPAIQIVAPVDGVYMLIRHAPEGDDLDRHAQLWAGETARFPLYDLDASYHVQVMQDPAASLAMLESIRHRPPPHVYFLGQVGN